MVTHEASAHMAVLVDSDRRRAGVPIARLAEETGIPRTTLTRKLKGLGDFTIPELYSIGERLGSSVIGWVSDLPEIHRDPPKPKYAVDPETGCWNWLGTIDPAGYGHYPDGELSHRVFYEENVGPLVKGMHIDHLCRNRKCCNPEHLEQVTPRENILRGYGAAAMEARKTHCVNGHEFNDENTRIVHRKRGDERMCVECNRAKQRSIYWRKKAEAAASEVA